MLSLRYYSEIINNFVEFFPVFFICMLYIWGHALIMNINISLIISIFNVEFHKPDF